jgi:ankyrin repeat protein
MNGMPPFELHRRAFYGDLLRVHALLDLVLDPDGVDPLGYTPLMYAAASPNASVDMLRLLVEHGADVNFEVRDGIVTTSVLQVAIDGGDIAKLCYLIERGANIRFCTASGYDALIRAVHSDAPDLLGLFRFLLSQGVALNGITTYNESAVRILSRVGRFDAVKFLLDAGADASRLEWTPLMYAVAIGSLDDVKAVLRRAPKLEERDSWSRTPWLLSIQTGDIEKAKALLDAGADRSTVGRCGIPALLHAVESGGAGMLQWLLSIGIPVEQTDEAGTSALIAAIEKSAVDLVGILIRAGCDVIRQQYGQGVLTRAQDAQIVRLLLDAGADPVDLSHSGKRSLLGFPPNSHYFLMDCDTDQFRSAPTRRFGAANPEAMAEPFWTAMIACGLSAAEAAQLFKFRPEVGTIWCAQRFGQSVTNLEDGRIVLIGGEHEDYYDEDFCIYNDVFIHEPGGSVRILGYPKEIFAPTDFHTATQIGEFIYVVGGLGYPESRRIGETPVYEFSLRDFGMRRLVTTGDAPGWIYKHRAHAAASAEIRVESGVFIGSREGRGGEHINEHSFVLNVTKLVWRRT